MTWAAFLTASGLTIAACTALFVVEWLAARNEHNKRAAGRDELRAARERRAAS